jgi:hypothetical protein
MRNIKYSWRSRPPLSEHSLFTLRHASRCDSAEIAPRPHRPHNARMPIVEHARTSTLSRACRLFVPALVLVLVSTVARSAHAQPPTSTESTVEPVATPAVSQAPLSAAAYVPITGPQRVDWIVGGTIGRRSLGVGVLADAWQTGFNTPEEWGRSWSGIGKRYLEREADVAISSTIEAGAGAMWGEDPRYVRSGRRGLWPRTRYALKTVFLAQRRDGHLAPAWGRYAGNVFNNVIENTWLPPSATTAGQTVFRSASGFLGRAGGNLFDEFWPDVMRHFKNRRREKALDRQP